MPPHAAACRRTRFSAPQVGVLPHAAAPIFGQNVSFVFLLSSFCPVFSLIFYHFLMPDNDEPSETVNEDESQAKRNKASNRSTADYLQWAIGHSKEPEGHKKVKRTRPRKKKNIYHLEAAVCACSCGHCGSVILNWDPPPHLQPHAICCMPPHAAACRRTSSLGGGHFWCLLLP